MDISSLNDYIILRVMKKTSTVKISKTTAFNPKSYERGGITEDEIL